MPAEELEELKRRSQEYKERWERDGGDVPSLIFWKWIEHYIRYYSMLRLRNIEEDP